MGKELVFNKTKTQGKDLQKIFHLYTVAKREYEQSVENNKQPNYTDLLKTLERKIWNEFQKVLMSKIGVLCLTSDEAELLSYLLSEELENIKQTPIGTLLNSKNQDNIQKSIDEFIDIAEKFSLIVELINALNDNEEENQLNN